MKPRKKVNNLKFKKQGASLIELMIAIIILAIIAITGGAVIRLSRTALAVQRDKHAALTEAIRIMELARVTQFLHTSATDYYFYEGSDGQLFSNNNTEPDWEIDINGRPRNISGTIAHISNDSPYLGLSGNFNEVTISIDYKDDASVTLQTIITNSD